MKYLSIIALLALTNCAYSIKEVDTSKADPGCVRQCSQSYSSCASSGPVIGFKTETLRACKEAYEICINTCEPRK